MQEHRHSLHRESPGSATLDQEVEGRRDFRVGRTVRRESQLSEEPSLPTGAPPNKNYFPYRHHCQGAAQQNTAATWCPSAIAPPRNPAWVAGARGATNRSHRLRS